MIYEDVTHTIGHTPLVTLSRMSADRPPVFSRNSKCLIPAAASRNE
jgi:hypothetical protein